MVELLADAERGKFAVCYCESWNLESLQAVVEAAEELQAPTIVGFNGGFLMHSSRSRAEELEYYAGIGLAAVQASNVPMALLLNESDNLSQIQHAMELGFNTIMVENANLEFDEYRRLVKKVVAEAHVREVSVEAQIGHLPCGARGSSAGSELTDPNQARAFIEETGIDALGISIGNVHIQTAGKAALDLETLRQIRNATEAPLVLHGGTSLPPECMGEAIALGVAKLNFGTNLKQAYLEAVRSKLAEYQPPVDPHPFLGKGGVDDIMVAGREAVKQKVKDLIQSYGYAGKKVAVNVG